MDFERVLEPIRLPEPCKELSNAKYLTDISRQREEYAYRVPYYFYSSSWSGHCGLRANENFPLFSYLSDSKDQTIIEKVSLANDRDN